MITVRKAKKMQAIASGVKRDGESIALVPTMGALHKGHLSLVRRARRLGDVVVVSIYVNKTQFAPGEDLDKYPRSLKQDMSLLRKLGVEYLFLPDDTEMYPSEFLTYVETEGITSLLEGNSRPTHFRGVTTIVAKLFNIVMPDVAVFGQKDAQQAIVIKRMVADLNMPVKIAVAPTVREKSGLAMSSRNRYFDGEQNERASRIYQGLKRGRDIIRSGESSSRKVISAVKTSITGTKGTEIDYISINDANTLDKVDRIDREVLILVAVRLDGIRLIDNVRVRPSRRKRK